MIFNIVIDTNVLIAGLRSKNGASYRLLRLIEDNRFQIHLSTTLVLEYEEQCLQHLLNLWITENQIQDVIDYICANSIEHGIFYLWRQSQTKDPDDAFIMELAVSAKADIIITYNRNDFPETEKFGIKIMTPLEFLKEIGEVK